MVDLREDERIEDDSISLMVYGNGARGRIELFALPLRAYFDSTDGHLEQAPDDHAPVEGPDSLAGIGGVAMAEEAARRA